MQKVYRKWTRCNGKKLYSISDPNTGVSVGNFSSRRKAEEALLEGQRLQRSYQARLKK